MPSVDVQHELLAIFERLGHIEREIDEVEAELRIRAREIAGAEQPDPPAAP